MDREALIFLHIPKTAGTTLNRIVEWHYSAFSIYTIDPYRIRATAERLKRLPEGRRRRFRVVRGHLYYGLHEFLPQGATYITMLREPVARFLSSYYFILRRPLHPLHRKLKKERLGVEDYLRLTPHRQNFQCQLIAGVKNGTGNDHHWLGMAKEHRSRSFSVVGICERFEESLMLMAKTFGWEVPFYENQKVSKSRPMVEPKLVDLIREHNRLDDELYEFGKKLFEQSPIHYVSEDDPPFLIVHGEADRVVPVEQSQRFYEELRKARVNATLKILPPVGHQAVLMDAVKRRGSLLRCDAQKALKTLP
jgi:Galactose-3-O-sulfotransferase/Prolyl oligopeptidase family